MPVMAKFSNEVKTMSRGKFNNAPMAQRAMGNYPPGEKDSKMDGHSANGPMNGQMHGRCCWWFLLTLGLLIEDIRKKCEYFGNICEKGSKK